jgi:hypothetical protein
MGSVTVQEKWHTSNMYIYLLEQQICVQDIPMITSFCLSSKAMFKKGCRRRPIGSKKWFCVGMSGSFAQRSSLVTGVSTRVFFLLRETFRLILCCAPWFISCLFFYVPAIFMVLFRLRLQPQMMMEYAEVSLL